MATVTDKNGHVLELRKQDIMLSMDVFEAAGVDGRGKAVGHLLQNDRWMGHASLACFVSSIDGVPEPMPTNIQQIKALIGKLGGDGLNAVAEALSTADAATVNEDAAKN